MKPLADLIATPTRPTCRPTRTTTRFCIASADDAGAAPRAALVVGRARDASGSASSSVASGKPRLPVMAAAAAGSPPSPDSGRTHCCSSALHDMPFGGRPRGLPVELAVFAALALAGARGAGAADVPRSGGGPTCGAASRNASATSGHVAASSASQFGET